MCLPKLNPVCKSWNEWDGSYCTQTSTTNGEACTALTIPITLNGKTFWGCLPRTGEGAPAGADACNQGSAGVHMDVDEEWFNMLAGAC